MKYIIPIFIFLSSCAPSAFKSQKALNKVDYYHPELLSKYCAKTFPPIVDSVTTIDTQGFFANNINYSGIIDSLYKASLIQFRPLQANDTCREKVQPYLNQILRLNSIINNLKDSYKPCDTSLILINNRTAISQENTAALDTSNRRNGIVVAEKNKLEGSNKTLKWGIISSVVLNLVLAVIIILIMKFKVRIPKLN